LPNLNSEWVNAKGTGICDNGNIEIGRDQTEC